MRFFSTHKSVVVDADTALPGREKKMPVPERHEVLGTPLVPPFPEGVEVAIFGMGCFWGAERIFWETPGVYTTAVGYAGGFTPNPTYEEVCTGLTGHAEAVLVAFRARPASGEGEDGAQANPRLITATTTFADMLKLFWEGHDPTQGMRQGNDVGSQYRSLIIPQSEAQRDQAEASRTAFQRQLESAGYGEITTEIAAVDAATGTFYYAEDYHQQYLAKNPGGYCGLGGTGVSCPIGLTVPAEH